MLLSFSNSNRHQTRIHNLQKSCFCFYGIYFYVSTHVHNHVCTYIVALYSEEYSTSGKKAIMMRIQIIWTMEFIFVRVLTWMSVNCNWLEMYIFIWNYCQNRRNSACSFAAKNSRCLLLILKWKGINLNEFSLTKQPVLGDIISMHQKLKKCI